MGFGSRLKWAMRRAGLDSKALARRVDCDARTIERHRSAIMAPKKYSAELTSIAAALDVQVGFLLVGQPAPTPGFREMDSEGDDGFRRPEDAPPLSYRDGPYVGTREASEALAVGEEESVVLELRFMEAAHWAETLSRAARLIGGNTWDDQASPPLAKTAEAVMAWHNLQTMAAAVESSCGGRDALRKKAQAYVKARRESGTKIGRDCLDGTVSAAKGAIFNISGTGIPDENKIKP